MKKHIIYFFLTLILYSIYSVGALVYSKPASKFPHKMHVVGNGLKCAECHTKIENSKTTDGAQDIPSKGFCFKSCHEEKDEKINSVKFRYQQEYKINHKLHIKDQGLPCKECHDIVYKSDDYTQSQAVAKMDYCYGCHDNTTAPKYCMVCHIRNIRPEDHDATWDKKHKLKADENLNECISCHKTKNFCQDCHKGVTKLKKPLSIHEPNYETTHRFNARLGMKNCYSCHTDNQCRNCHASKGLDNKIPGYRQIHPQGWNNINSPQFHAKKAKLRLSACTSCHTRNDCAYCHINIKKK